VVLRHPATAWPISDCAISHLIFPPPVYSAKRFFHDNEYACVKHPASAMPASARKSATLLDLVETEVLILSVRRRQRSDREKPCGPLDNRVAIQQPQFDGFCEELTAIQGLRGSRCQLVSPLTKGRVRNYSQTPNSANPPPWRSPWNKENCSGRNRRCHRAMPGPCGQSCRSNDGAAAQPRYCCGAGR
jgi:hypothetical protein